MRFPDTGFDSIEDQVFMEKLSALLREQDATDELPKTILYCLNPLNIFPGPLFYICLSQGAYDDRYCYRYYLCCGSGIPHR